MTSIVIDFDFDDEYAEMLDRAGKNAFTLINDGEATLDEIKDLLAEGQVTKKIQDKERLGYLKIYDDEDRLVGLSLPRVIDPIEYKAWCLPKEKTYHRMGMIFIDEPYRGQGLAKRAAELFKMQFPNILWTIDPTNEPSKKVASHIGLTRNATLYIRGTSWRHTPWEHDRRLEVWSN